MLTLLQTLILSFVEGITEFLPISSTGHLILASSVLHIQQTDFLKSFEIIIQCGAIFAVIVVYFNRIIKNFEMIKRIMVAFVPTGIIGFFLYSFVKHYLIGNYVVVCISLIIGGVLLIVFDYKYTHKQTLDSESTDLISYKHCAYLGIFQSLAMVPGVSRSAATILGALFLGYNRKTAVEFSFLLAIPTMIAATGLDVVKNVNTIVHSKLSMLVVGFIVSALVAFVAIRWLISYVERNSFAVFGVYRIVLGIVFLLYFFA